MDGSGLRDWIVQRFTALFLTFYLIFLVAFIIQQPSVDFAQWHALFSHPVMRIATLFGLICIALHAWIGLWTILTDYVKYLWIRYLLQAAILLALFGYFVWGVWIVWGI